MAIDPKKVLVGAPDQSATTGAVNYADLGTTLPTDARTALSEDFTDCGYVSPEGLVISPEYSIVAIKDWSLSKIRSLLEEFTGEMTFTFIQTDYDSLVSIFGEDNVTKTDATATSGEIITIRIGARLPPAKVYAFNMKDGAARARVILPNAQPVLNGEISFVANAAINWPVKLECNANADGDSIIIITDDGVTTA